MKILLSSFPIFACLLPFGALAQGSNLPTGNGSENCLNKSQTPQDPDDLEDPEENEGPGGGEGGGGGNGGPGGNGGDPTSETSYRSHPCEESVGTQDGVEDETNSFVHTGMLDYHSWSYDFKLPGTDEPDRFFVFLVLF